MNSVEHDRETLIEIYKKFGSYKRERAEELIVEFQDDSGVFYHRMARAYNEAVAKLEEAKTREDLERVGNWIDSEIWRIMDALDLMNQATGPARTIGGRQ